MNKETVTITVLVENTVSRQALKTEHGLSFLIQTEDGNLLWDTGQTDLLINNAQRLGISLSSTTHKALSHGHYDHTGGLLEVLKMAPHAYVYGHPDLFVQRFIKKRNEVYSVEPVSSPMGKDIVKGRCESLILSPEPAEILPGIFTTGEIPRETDFEDTGGDFFLDIACTKRDPIIDDQALYIESSQGIVVILGCAHSGVVNTIDYVSELTRQGKIFAVLGGMHLPRASKERLEATAAAFVRYDVQIIGPCHCTGLKAITYLRSQFPNHLVECSTGSYFTFEGKQ
ncbi:MAG: MBL fold metallo-hydrolase [Candidatus Latescibacteria bacterium]|nr:MBL fold metallo-hydrolase [Candidatus Latescibacterota bacterium]